MFLLKLTYVAKNVSFMDYWQISKDILDRACTLLFYFILLFISFLPLPSLAPFSSFCFSPFLHTSRLFYFLPAFERLRFRCISRRTTMPDNFRFFDGGIFVRIIYRLSPFIGPIIFPSLSIRDLHAKIAWLTGIRLMLNDDITFRPRFSFFFLFLCFRAAQFL